ncbi:unnamed protein product [Coregonus sp. 'balchen']|nr:unnamed protein product [Coregonus sp. 'balchen']
MSKEPVKRERNLHNRGQSKRDPFKRDNTTGFRRLMVLMYGLAPSDSDYENANRTADVFISAYR